MGDVMSNSMGSTGSTLAGEGKAPRTARGAKTMRKILDAAIQEFGERGFADSSIVSITSRAKVALGTFYTYFDSKEALFAALVRDMSDQVKRAVAPVFADAPSPLDAERRALAAFLRFARDHREVYRIIDESEFVDPVGFADHYNSTAARIRERLDAAAAGGHMSPARSDLEAEVRAWALMGMNVFLGLRFSVWDDADADAVAEAASRLVRDGLV